MEKSEPRPFSGLRFPIHDIPSGTDLVHKFKELQDYPEFAQYEHADRNYVIRYVFYCYDMRSDLIKQYPDLTKRKEAAAELAGFARSDKTGKFKLEVYDMMALKNEDVNNMIFCFLTILNEMLWSLIVVNENMFDEYLRLLMDPIFGKDSKNTLDAATVKTKLSGDVKNIRNDITAFYKELFGDNEELKEIKKKKPINPETIHKTLKQ